MKRTAILFIAILFLLGIGFGKTAINPDNFTGEWYSADDQSVYVFQEGIIYSQKHGIAIGNSDSISGAYIYGGKSVLLFTYGIETLKTEKELYLVKRDGVSYLCENKDGTGTVYFIRHNN